MAAVINRNHASPKSCASPPRTRHNPYARSPATPSGTPVNEASATPPQMSANAPLPMPSMTSNDSFTATPPTSAVMPPQGAAEAWNPNSTVDSAHSGHGMMPAYSADGGDMSSFAGDQHAFGIPEPMLGSFSQQGSYYDAAPPQHDGNAMAMPAAYDMDPAMAVMMFQNASAAAANAASSRFQPGGSGKSNRGSGRGPSADGASGAPTSTPRFEDLQAMAGTLAEQVRTASGSSYVQAAVKDTQDLRCIQLVWSELSSSLGDLLLDAHGCYVIKTLLDHLPPEEVRFVLASISDDEQLGFSVCTHSLHTRRIVQHIIENIDGGFLCELMSRHCADVAMTQQGCIVMQRAMDHAPEGPAREALFEAISENIVNFAKDPFANYVVQHLMEVGERVETAGSMWKSFRGRIVELACNKFASNVVEKCLFHCTAEVQHEMLLEMYSIGPQMLYNMLQDSFGNYIIQSSIALATFRDVSLINDRLRPVLAHTPYGYKIEARLDRRLKGKPVTARSVATGGSGGGSAPSGPSHAQSSSGGRRSGGRRSDKAGSQSIPSGESSW